MPSRSDAVAHWWPRALAAVAVAAGVAAFWLSDRTIATDLRIALAFGGAALAALLVTSRPIAAFGIVFLLASMSDLVVELPPGTMRLEQPSLAILLAAVAARAVGASALPWWPRLRPLLPVAVAGGIYLVALLVSSALVAPQPVASLRFAAWTALSMTGGVLAYLLVARDALRAGDAVLGMGMLTAIAGLVIATGFYVGGPFALGIQDPLSRLPRVDVWVQEANLYASFVGAMVPLAVERFRRRPDAMGTLVVVASVVAMALGITRGAWLGLVAGLVVQGVILVARREPRLVLGRMVALTIAGAVLGLALTSVLLDPRLQAERANSGGPGSVEPSETQGGTDQTIEFRLKRITPALEDLRTSPLIGMGADSFGQRHGDPTQGGAPDHLAIMALAVVYESGLVGMAALAALGVLVARALWRASAREPATRGLAAAYAGSLTVIAVAYQATNALHFAWGWLMVGAAMGLAARPHPPDAEPVPQRSMAAR